MKFQLILVAISLSCLLSAMNVAFAQHNHLEATFVDWGIDEFQFFGKTQPELTKTFGSEVNFEVSDKSTIAHLSPSSNGPQFILTFSNGKVSKVQRMFIDGMGCHIMGPLFNSKGEALKFSIAGLTKLGPGDAKVKQKLDTDEKLLRAIEGTAKASANSH